MRNMCTAVTPTPCLFTVMLWCVFVHCYVMMSVGSDMICICRSQFYLSASWRTRRQKILVQQMWRWLFFRTFCCWIFKCNLMQHFGYGWLVLRVGAFSDMTSCHISGYPTNIYSQSKLNHTSCANANRAHEFSGGSSFGWIETYQPNIAVCGSSAGRQRTVNSMLGVWPEFRGARTFKLTHVRAWLRFVCVYLFVLNI